jgi:hypothetical protein
MGELIGLFPGVAWLCGNSDVMLVELTAGAIRDDVDARISDLLSKWEKSAEQELLELPGMDSELAKRIRDAREKQAIEEEIETGLAELKQMVAKKNRRRRV